MPKRRAHHSLFVSPLTLALSHKGRGDTSVLAAKVSVQKTNNSVNLPPLTLTLSRKGRGKPVRVPHFSNNASKNLLHRRFSPSLDGVAPPLPSWERAGVRGRLRPIYSKRRCDLRQRAFGIGEDIVIPKPEHPKTILLQTHRSLGVAGHAALTCVLAAVEFDDEFGVEATKICNVGADGDLSAEFDAVKAAVAQQRPQFSLGFGLISSEETRARHTHKIRPLTLALSHEGRGDFAQLSHCCQKNTRKLQNHQSAPSPLAGEGRGEG